MSCFARRFSISLSVVLAANCLGVEASNNKAQIGEDRGQEPSEALENTESYGRPIVARNADGLLEIFRVEANGEFRHRWQIQANGDWGAWSSLGGKFLPEVVVVPDSVGRLNAFAIEQGSGKLCQCRQQATNSHEWSSWVPMGQGIAPPLTAAQDKRGGIEVFALDATARTVKTIRQTDSEEWPGWTNLGGHIADDLVAASSRDGSLELFGIAQGSGELVHCSESAGWSKWKGLGGKVLPGLVVGQNAAGLLEIFGVSRENGHINRLKQRSAADAEKWTDWEDFGGEFEPGIALGQSADKRLELLAVSRTNGVLMHKWELLVDGSDRWSDWATMGNTAPPWPAVGQNEDGNLEVFARDRANPGVINHRGQISKASDWLDWSSLDHATFRYSTRTWQVDEGLPDNVVEAIAQTRDGYLWLGTRAGLARFDGTSFKVFDERNTPELKASGINVLCADRQGTLWIGTEGGGLVRLAAGRFHHFDESLAGKSIKAIYEGRDGSLWIGTTNGMLRYKDRRFTRYTTKDGLSADVVTSIFEDQGGDLWIGTGKGLNRFKNGQMEAFAMPNQLPGDSVRAICQDRGGRIWIGSNNGMLWYNWYWSKSFYAYNSKYGLSDAFVSAICEDREGNLWVGTYSGLNRFREGRFFNELKSEGSPFDRVYALFEDREGNLWVGSREGLTRLTPERFFAYTKRQGLSHNNVMSVLEDRSGSMWVATWGGGLNQIRDEKAICYLGTNGAPSVIEGPQGATEKPLKRLEGSGTTQLKLGVNESPGVTGQQLCLPQTLTLSLAEGRDGSLWVGSDFDGGLARLKDGTFRIYTVKDGLIAAGIKVIQEDREGTLWIGTTRGLSSFKSGKFTNYATKDGLAGDLVRAICEDSSGALWVGTDRGLQKIEIANSKIEGLRTAQGLSGNKITALYADKDANLWIGTLDGGLNRYRDGKFKAYTTKDGLYSDEIFDILEDDSGWLWMSCSRGIFRVRKRELDAIDRGKTAVVASLVYGKGDGIESPQCSGSAKPGAWKARDGKLWFATSIGVVCVDPQSVRMNRIPPPVYIEQLYADRNAQIQVGLLSHDLISPPLAEPPVSAEQPLRVPAGRGELEFHFAVINFHAPEKCRVKYKLEGVDPEWTEAGQRRSAHYNNISPGDYTFRVTACNEDGVWNRAGAELPITMLPHIWQTWWLQGMIALGTLGAAAGMARYAATKRIRRRLELLEQRQAIEKERARIAKDMHDQLGAGLTQVGLLGELARRDAEKPQQTKNYAAKICELAREQAQTLDEIVWTIEPRNDLLNKLAAYMAAYAEQFFASASMRCRLDIPAHLPALTVSAELRHSLLLVVKEALHNVVKHAEATDVRLGLSLTGSTLRIVIEDNGRGFVPSGLDGSGTGLGSMKERMEEIGGSFDLRSDASKGTTVVCTVPLERHGGLIAVGGAAAGTGESANGH